MGDRNTKIKSWKIENLSSRQISILIEFESVQDVSQGGSEYMDILRVDVLAPQLFIFEARNVSLLQNGIIK